MMSDYEILVLKEIKKGKNDPKKIARDLGLPEAVVRVAMKKVKGKGLGKKKRSRIVFTRESLKLLIDVLILYILINAVMQVILWF